MNETTEVVYKQVNELFEAAFSLMECLASPDAEMTERGAAWASFVVARAKERLERIRVDLVSTCKHSGTAANGWTSDDRAVALLAANPDLTVREIAAEVGVHHGTMYRQPKFRVVAEKLGKVKPHRPRPPRIPSKVESGPSLDLD